MKLDKSLKIGVGIAALSAAAVGASGALAEPERPAVRAAVSYVASIGGPATSAVEAKQVDRISKAGNEHGFSVVGGSLRAVEGPEGRATWTVAATSTGGACVVTTDLLFCDATPAGLASGGASATVYPADTVVSPRRADGTIGLAPSKEPGVRYGIAPEGATEVVTRTQGGRELARAAVDRGLYRVTVPPQDEVGSVDFLSRGQLVSRRSSVG